MAIRKKKVVEKVVEKAVETPVEETVKPAPTPKKEVKEWTYDELVILPRAEYLKVEADIKAGRATVKQE
jgi:phosphoribosyl-ATP pyrophosphohydrolase